MPMAIAMFYGVNMIGAIANMIHPLSAEGEIEFYLNDSESRRGDHGGYVLSEI